MKIFRLSDLTSIPRQNFVNNNQIWMNKRDIRIFFFGLENCYSELFWLVLTSEQRNSNICLLNVVTIRVKLNLSIIFFQYRLITKTWSLIARWIKIWSTLRIRPDLSYHLMIKVWKYFDYATAGESSVWLSKFRLCLRNVIIRDFRYQNFRHSCFK